MCGSNVFGRRAGVASHSDKCKLINKMYVFVYPGVIPWKTVSAELFDFPVGTLRFTRKTNNPTNYKD